MVGTSISHYRILSELGRGGMGVVYKAEDMNLGRAVALKVLPTHSLGGESERARFFREARSAAALSHAHIATIYEVGEHDGSPFIAMEYVEGESLEARVEAGPLPIPEALRLGQEIASALEAAHEAGIVHRDIKCANVMLTKKRSAKVLDFGLAKGEGATTITQEGSTVGTIAYMSPEQARGEAVDQRTDLFSLGVVLYEMVTGRRPFQGAYESAVIYSIMNVDPEPMTALRTGVPMELERITNKAMAKEAASRYQSATDLIVDLRNLERAAESAGVSTPAQDLVRDSVSRPVSFPDSDSASGADTIVTPGPVSKSRRTVFSALAIVAVIVAVIAVLIVGRSLLMGPASGTTIDSIAVLPFVNMTGDVSNEYITDGMTEALINELGRIQALTRVISFTSVRQYKDAMKPLPDIGDELGISAIVEGSLKSSGTDLHIDVRLLDAQSENRLWEQNYQRALRDVPALQKEVALAISRELEVALTPVESIRLSASGSVDPEAHRAYLQGRFYFNKWTEEGFETALEYFKLAIREDSAYALGYAGLSDTYNILGNVGFRPQAEVKPLAKAAALTVLELDESLAEGHVSLASIWLTWEWNFEEGERELQRAIELNPNYVMAHQWNAQWSNFKGQYDAALAAIRRALELDPLSFQLIFDYGWILHWAGKYEEASATLEKALEIDPVNPYPAYELFIMYTRIGLIDDARDSLQEYLRRQGRGEDEMAAILELYDSEGAHGIWKWELNNLLERSSDSYVDPGELASMYALVGEKDKALDWLEKGVEMKSVMALMAKSHPYWESLHGDSRFEEIIRRIGLSD